MKSADQALRAPHARPLSSLEKSYSIIGEMPAFPWSCRVRRTRILLRFSDDYERFARPDQEVQKRELELGDQLVYRERQLTQLTDLGKEALHADVASRALKVGDVAPDRHPPL
ncbi:hypothetical protein [Bradyrhizobium sp. 139]|uniref:hypothetical protein n=1 Tax=Bradyrhizobium sp. 139 TaxID=2782616 RepID=UPI001FF8E616|nr:hypothetical protein [Bradyrhizobium sp. 139]